MIIKDWWYVIKVCMKYKIWWNPFCKLDHGNYTWNSCIAVNPFDANLMTIFMHEVGHHVHHKRVNMPVFLEPMENELRWGTNGSLSGRSVYKVLDSEGIASRFAVRSGKVDKVYLLKAFNTYSAMIFRKMNNSVVVNEFSDIVDCVYKNIRRIEK